MRVIARLLIGLLLANCGVSRDCETGKPGQCQAEDIVWYGLYNQDKPPPRVTWFDSCIMFYGHCAADGLFYSSNYTAQVVYKGRISSSAWAHEMLHAALFNRGIYDPDHKDPTWGVLVPVANKLLKEVGL